MKQLTGIIRSMPPTKFFGFIRANDTEFFFHRDDFKGNWENLVYDFNSSNKSLEVEFEVSEGPKGPRASNVKRIHDNKMINEDVVL